MSKTLYLLRTPFAEPSRISILETTAENYVCKNEVGYRISFRRAYENIVTGQCDELQAFTTDPAKLSDLEDAMTRKLIAYRNEITARHSKCMEAITKFVTQHAPKQ